MNKTQPKTDRQKLVELAKWLRKRGYATEKTNHTVAEVEFEGKPTPRKLQFYLDADFGTFYATFSMGFDWKVAVNGDTLRWEARAENFTKPNINGIIRLFKTRAVVEKPKTEAQLKQEKIERLEEEIAKLKRGEK